MKYENIIKEIKRIQKEETLKAENARLTRGGYYHTGCVHTCNRILSMLPKPAVKAKEGR